MISSYTAPRRANASFLKDAKAALCALKIARKIGTAKRGAF